MEDTQNKDKNPTTVIADQREWTTNRAIQNLKYELATFTDKDYEQAQYLIYRIPVHRPTPHFKVYISDLSERMKEELGSYNRKSLTFVLKQAIGRIFEDIHAEYYHDSVSSLLEVDLL
jgi:hypothetical protein